MGDVASSHWAGVIDLSRDEDPRYSFCKRLAACSEIEISVNNECKRIRYDAMNNFCRTYSRSAMTGKWQSHALRGDSPRTYQNKRLLRVELTGTVGTQDGHYRQHIEESERNPDYNGGNILKIGYGVWREGCQFETHTGTNFEDFKRLRRLEYPYKKWELSINMDQNIQAIRTRDGHWQAKCRVALKQWSDHGLPAQDFSNDHEECLVTLRKFFEPKKN